MSTGARTATGSHIIRFGKAPEHTNAAQLHIILRLGQHDIVHHMNQPVAGSNVSGHNLGHGRYLSRVAGTLLKGTIHSARTAHGAAVFPIAHLHQMLTT